MIRIGIIYTQADDPGGHGLSCMDCDRVLEYGDEIAERLTGMVKDIPLVEIICGPCGHKASQENV